MPKLVIWLTGLRGENDMRFKYVFVVILTLLLVPTFFIFSSAASFTPYAGVTESSSQVQLLYGYYVNQADFSYTDEFLLMRSGQYAYYLFYGSDLSSGNVKYISYIGTSSSSASYNVSYTISSGSMSGVSFNLNDYSTVGNVVGSAALTEHMFSYQLHLLFVLLSSFLLLFIFNIFRSHFRELKS